MQKPDSIKVWPYNLICESMGIKDADSLAWEGFEDDPNEVIGKVFRSVRLSAGSFKGTGRALGAIIDHYQKGEAIVDVLRENEVGRKLYYSTLSQVYSMMRTYIYKKKATIGEPMPADYVRKTGPNRPVEKTPEQLAEAALLSNRVDYDTYPWNVFKNIHRRDLINLLPDPDMVGDEIISLAQAICKGLDSIKPGEGQTVHLFFNGRYVESKSAATLAGMYRSNKVTVMKYAGKVTTAILWYISLYDKLFPDEPIQFDRPELRMLAECGVFDDTSLAKFAPSPNFCDVWKPKSLKVLAETSYTYNSHSLLAKMVNAKDAESEMYEEVTIKIPKGSVPGYFINGQGFFFVGSEMQEDK